MTARRRSIEDAIIWMPSRTPRSYEAVYELEEVSRREGQLLRIEVPLPEGKYKVEVCVSKVES